MDPIAPGDITALLNAAGRQEADERLAELVYHELRRIAHRVMAPERNSHTLQPTVVAHEAYFKLRDQGSHNWTNRNQFFATAAQAMRQILVDYGRRRQSQKRGGMMKRVDLDAVGSEDGPDLDDLLILDQALSRLELHDSRMAKIVELRYFSGLTEEETASVMGVGLRTVKRDWSFARTWLHAELTRKKD